ncbi:MAG: peptide deformylase [Alphaproteobacteria bacterium]|nr:peptide deformylase [Alphaproteobacteria bacterium]
MTVLNVLIAPHSTLSTKAAVVTVFDDALRQQLNDMTETMYADNGIGLAANQVGILKRIIVMDIGDDNSLTRDPNPIKQKLFYFINPEIEWTSDEQVVFEEGCLSVPGQSIPVERSASLRLRYHDETGKEKTETFHGLQARCILHEIDHINGKTMLDYLSKLKKDLAVRKIMKHYSSR